MKWIIFVLMVLNSDIRASDMMGSEICLPINIPSGNGTKMVPAFEVYSCNASSLETADLTICGTDGISYKNECEFNRKKCQDPKCLEDGSNCIEKMCKGKCPCRKECHGITDPYENLESWVLSLFQIPISKIPEKICGKSGRTYNGARFFQYDSCMYEYDEIDCLGQCPCNSRECMENLEITLKNTTKSNYPDFEGTYILATDRITGRPYWILTDQNATMWYDNNNWIINDESKLGTAQGLFMNIVEKATCPTTGNWTALDLDTGEWIKLWNFMVLKSRIWPLKYVKCDDKADCQDIYGNTMSIQCLPEFNACAPLKCVDDTDCLSVALPRMEHDFRELFGGSCNKEFNCEYSTRVLNINVSSGPFPGSDFPHLDNNSSGVINSCLVLLAYGFVVYLFFS